MVSFNVEMVSILPEDFRQAIIVQVLTLGKVNGHHKKVLLEQHLQTIQDVTISKGLLCKQHTENKLFINSGSTDT